MSVAWQLVVLPSIVFADEPLSVVETIRKDWLKRFEKARSVHCKLAGTAMRPKGMSADAGDPSLPEGHPGMPLTDYSFPFSSRWDWDLYVPRFSRDWEGETLYLDQIPRFAKLRTTCVFSGETIQKLKISDQSPNIAAGRLEVYQLEIYPNKRLFDFITPNDNPILYSLGLFMPEDWRLLDSVETLSAQHLALSLVGNAQHDQHDCVVVDVTRAGAAYGEIRDRLWVDLACDSAVRKAEHYFSGKLGCRFEADFVNKDFGWFPTQWESSYFRTSGNESPQLTAHQSAKVLELSLNELVPPNLAEIPVRPGMIVINEKTGEPTYEIGQDGHTKIPRKRRRVVANSALRLWIGGSLLIATAVAAFAIRSRSINRNRVMT